MPSYLDLGVIAIVLISALLSMVRGLTREVLAIGSWVAAGFAALYGYTLVLPYVTPYVAKPAIATPVAAAVVFFVTLILVSIITIKLSDIILDSKIGALDRTLGLLFGAARGFLLCVVAMVFFNWLVAEKQQPDWVKTAKIRPYLESSGVSLQALLPDDIEARLKNLKLPKGDGSTEANPSAPTPPASVPLTPAAPVPTSTAPTAAEQQKLNQLAAPPKKP